MIHLGTDSRTSYSFWNQTPPIRSTRRLLRTSRPIDKGSFVTCDKLWEVDRSEEKLLIVCKSKEYTFSAEICGGLNRIHVHIRLSDE